MDRELYYPNKEERVKQLKQMSEPMFDAHKEIAKELNLPHNRRSGSTVIPMNPTLSWYAARGII